MDFNSQKLCRKYENNDMTRSVRRKLDSYNTVPKNPFELKIIYDNPDIMIKPSKKILKDIKKGVKEVIGDALELDKDFITTNY